MRKFALIGGMLGLTAVAFLDINSVASATSCAALHQEVEALGDRASVEEFKRLWTEAAKMADCTDTYREGLGRKVAVQLTKEIEAAMEGGATAISQKSKLEATLQYNRLWQVLAMLGDVEAESKNAEAASQRFQESLEVIANENLTRSPPPQDVIRSLFKKAETQRLLSTSYVPAPRNRAGVPTGLGAHGVRGFVPTARAVPITFRVDSVEFDEKGQAAAIDLAFQLKARNSPDITLVGHTDPRGTNAYNRTLSQRRAETVRAFLLQQNYSGKIETSGRGEEERFQPDDVSRYSDEQRFQMDRRVELIE